MWSQSGCHEYLKRLWLSVSACCVCNCYRAFSCSGTRWPNSSLKARLSTYMQIRRRWEHEFVDVWKRPALMTLYAECGFLSQFVILSCMPSYLQRAGQKDHLDILCTHTGGMQAPLEVWSGESSFLQVSLLSCFSRCPFHPDIMLFLLPSLCHWEV